MFYFILNYTSGDCSSLVFVCNTQIDMPIIIMKYSAFHAVTKETKDWVKKKINKILFQTRGCIEVFYKKPMQTNFHSGKDVGGGQSVALNIGLK